MRQGSSLVESVLFTNDARFGRQLDDHDDTSINFNGVVDANNKGQRCIDKVRPKLVNTGLKIANWL